MNPLPDKLLSNSWDDQPENAHKVLEETEMLSSQLLRAGRESTR